MQTTKDQQGIQTHLVGGAVRDELLGISVKDRDWVVVGATSQQMIDLGYRPIGLDFPVFLHPETKEEHALACVHRDAPQNAQGHQGPMVPSSRSKKTSGAGT